MDFENLTEDLKDKVVGLKHGASTIEYEVQDALENAQNIEEFREMVRDKMKSLIEECKDISETFYDTTPKSPIKVVVNMFGGGIESVSSEKPIDIIFKDPETDGVDDESLIKIDGDDYIVSWRDSDNLPADQAYIDSVFAQVKKAVDEKEKKG